MFGTQETHKNIAVVISANPPRFLLLHSMGTSEQKNLGGIQYKGKIFFLEFRIVLKEFHRSNLMLQIPLSSNAHRHPL